MGRLGSDYVTLNVTVLSVFEFGGTITRGETVFNQGGFTLGSLKSIASGKNWDSTYPSAIFSRLAQRRMLMSMC